MPWVTSTVSVYDLHHRIKSSSFFAGVEFPHETKYFFYLSPVLVEHFLCFGTSEGCKLCICAVIPSASVFFPDVFISLVLWTFFLQLNFFSNLGWCLGYTLTKISSLSSKCMLKVTISNLWLTSNPDLDPTRLSRFLPSHWLKTDKFMLSMSQEQG